MKKLLLLATLLLVMGCELQFYGDTFYKVKGKIVNANNEPVPQLKLSVFSAVVVDGFQYDYTAYSTISGKATTDKNGYFIITFPRSNGQNFLLLPEGYKIADSVSTNSLYPDLIKLDVALFNDYLFDAKTIRTFNP